MEHGTAKLPILADRMCQLKGMSVPFACHLARFHHEPDRRLVHRPRWFYAQPQQARQARTAPVFRDFDLQILPCRSVQNPDRVSGYRAARHALPGTEASWQTLVRVAAALQQCRRFVNAAQEDFRVSEQSLSSAAGASDITSSSAAVCL